MGLRSRLKGKIKDTVEGVSALARIIHDEANHPGRPQPHMAARNPLWGGGDVTDKEASSTPASSDVETEGLPDAPVQTAGADEVTPQETGDDFWFLHDPDGEVDDWSQTNPKKS